MFRDREMAPTMKSLGDQPTQLPTHFALGFRDSASQSPTTRAGVPTAFLLRRRLMHRTEGNGGKQHLISTDDRPLPRHLASAPRSRRNSATVPGEMHAN